MNLIIHEIFISEWTLSLRELFYSKYLNLKNYLNFKNYLNYFILQLLQWNCFTLTSSHQLLHLYRFTYLKYITSHLTSVRGPISYRICFMACRLFIAQLGPGLKSKTKALDHSRTLNLLWIHPPTHHPLTKNFLQGSRHRV